MTRLTKQCDCKSTSSGPRVVMSNSVEQNGAYTQTVSFVEMACDKCDAPWERQPSKKPTTATKP
jgi:hypothetical protein